MQTVNFQCGHCGKLMGVGSDFLGQQVRCPHCQQVVIAPPSAAQTPPPANPSPAVELSPAPQTAPTPEWVQTLLPPPPAASDSADIFAPTAASDDLFGRSEPPRIEMPPDPFAPTLPADNAAPPPEPAPTATFPFLPPAPAAPPADGDNTAMLPSAGGASPWLAGTVTETLAPLPAEAPVEVPVMPQPGPIAETTTPRPPRRRESRTPWFMILVFSPLLLYAIVITIFAALIYRQEQSLEQQIRNPFEKMPDVGDNPGVQKDEKRVKDKKRVWLDNYDLKRATLPLPDQLCTTLQADGKSEPIRIGDLEIKPLSVKRERVEIITENFESRPEPQLSDSLVLRISMKNLSSEYTFAPLDNYFDRYWRPGQDQHPPLTQLEVGGRYRFFGGPAHWYPRGSSNDKRQWVVGRKGFEPELLQPGEEKEFFVCTDGDDLKGSLLLFGEVNEKRGGPAYHGPLLWRIRVRRGVVQINDKQYSATAVVGVKFTDKDIR